MAILVDNKFEGAAKESLHRGDVHLTVALARVTIADLKERSLGVNGNIERGSGHEFLVVHVARVHPRRSAVDAARRRRRCNAHAAEEGMKWNLDTRSKLRHHLLTIERNDL